MSQAKAPKPNAPEPAAEQPLPTDMRGILRIGLFNYLMRRWAPKNPAARLAVEMALLVVFFGILAVLLWLTRG
jgi:hypothetical protein